MTGYNASIDTFTNADISRLRGNPECSFEIRDCREYSKKRKEFNKNERNAGRKNFEGN